jgi:hypothetical protein
MNVSVNELVGLVCTIPTFRRSRYCRNLDRTVVIKDVKHEFPPYVLITYVEIKTWPDNKSSLRYGTVERPVQDGKVLGVYASAKPTTDTERQLGVLYRQRERVKAAGVINGI